MATHNGKNRIIEAIESIKAQTYTKWKFIICDDGSTDGSYELLVERYSMDERFVIIRNDTNIGLAASLNRCLNFCYDFEFIARMDDDDISYPDRLEKQMKFLDTHSNISFVSSSVDIYNGNEIIERRILNEFPKKKELVWNSPFIHPATMFRAQDLYSVNGYRVAKETLRGQDYDLFMRMYGQGFIGANLIEPVYLYTENENTVKRRTFKARVGEYKIRKYGYKSMHVMWWAFPFLLKPFIAYLKDVIKKSH